MHRIDGPGHINNTFSEGDPAQGIVATVVTDDWMNAVQEELCAVVEEAGLALEKENNAQLLAALSALFAAASHVADLAGHGATSAAIAGRLVARDGAGRTRVAAGVDVDHAVNLGQLNGHAGLAKAAVLFEGIPTVIRASRNVASVVRNGAGDYTINFADDTFASADYMPIALAKVGGVVNETVVGIHESADAMQAGSLRIRVGDISSDGVLYSADRARISVVVF